MRAVFSTLFFLLLIGSTVRAQDVYAIKETLKLAELVPRQDATIYFKLPLNIGRQSVSNVQFSGKPTTVPATEGAREYAWRADEVGENDSLYVSYQVRPSIIEPWSEMLVDSLVGQSFAWPPIEEGAPDVPYVLPPLIREDVTKTEFSTIDLADTSLQDIHRLIIRLDRRIADVRDVDNFDYSQPLLEDVYRRRTTPRRKHLLLSLALQYLDIPHRVVAGKIVSFGEVRENELWVELAVAGNWYRVYYGDGVDRSEWGAPMDPDMFLACSFDYRDMTLEVINAPGTPVVPSILFSEAKNLVVDFWDRKNEALRAKSYSEAVAMIDSVLAYVPENVSAITEKGLVLAEAGRPEDGIPFLQHGIRTAKRPQDQSFALIQLAKLQASQRQGQEAVETLVRAHQIYPIDVSVLYNDYRFAWLSRQSSLMRRLEQGLQRIR